MSLTSVVINLKTNQKTVLDTAQVSVSAQNTLTLLRGKTFFTSACIIRNDKGMFLLCLDAHYERMVRCYQTMFERNDVPFSYETFKQYVEYAIDQNSHVEASYLHCVILCVAGKSRKTMFDTGTYANGFGGGLEEMIILIDPFESKPDWCFNEGINLVSFPYQRPLAEAKPTFYIGGVVAQHVLDAVNAYACVLKQTSENTYEHCLKAAFNVYEALSVKQQKTFRLCINSLFFSVATTIDFSDIGLLLQQLPKPIEQLLTSYLTAPSCNSIQLLLKNDFSQLLHETFFVSSDEQNPFVLEGSTFSLMGINQADECVFIPLKGNSTQTDDLNTGYILESTFTKMLLHIVKKANLNYKIEPILAADLTKLKALYCVSTRRCTDKELTFKFQPCRSINAQPLATETSKTYTKLLEYVNAFVDNYSYDVCITDTI